jgi:hypothetical protein
LSWPPTYEKVIIEAGDEHAAHSGSKGELLRLGALDVTAAEARTPDDDLFAPRREQVAESADEPAPTIIYAPEAEELGEVPVTDELQPWLKWLTSLDHGEQAGESE